MGNRIALIDGMGKTTQYIYDNLNRIKSVVYPAGSGTVNYGYDILGRRTSMTDSRGTTNYYYDKLGRL